MKFKAIDLFCGAGGLSWGLKKAGFHVSLGVDINGSALKTYKRNLKRTKILKKDIKEVTGEEISKLTGIKKGDIFLLAGCPPCQGFSNLGKREADNSLNRLVFEYVRLINELAPGFVLMENVPGMSKGIGKNIFSSVVDDLEKKYIVQYDTLNAADYGVPQIRKRLVLHGIRKDIYEILSKENNELTLIPLQTFSKTTEKGKKKWRTVGETIMDLPNIEAGEQCSYPDIYNHIARNLSDTNKQRLDYIRKHGGDRLNVSKNMQLDCHKKANVSYTDTYGVLDLNKPSPTITSGCTIISKGRYGHPTQNRGLSVREAARLQSFDDSFIFDGTVGEMSLQIGNAVPPKLAQASGKAILLFMNQYVQSIEKK